MPAGDIVCVSRHPLGQGSVTGFDVKQQPTTDQTQTQQDAAASLRYYVDTSRLKVAQETGLALGPAESPDARVWLHPADPHLPALPAVSFHRAAEQLFARLGLRTDGVTEFIGYRPGRRAVLRLAAHDEGQQPANRWIKIVRPSRVERIAQVHDACAAARLPVPQMLAWSKEGVILSDSALGTPGPEFDWHTPTLLDEADRLMEQFTSVEVSQSAKGVAGRLDWYASRIAASPTHELLDKNLVHQVVRDARTVLDSAPSGPLRVVHGDLHFGQLFFDPAGHITSVIDVDTTGVGDPAEDPAALIAHATASAMLKGSAGHTRVWELADEGMQRWGDDPRVRGLFAVHCLGHTLTAIDGGDYSRAKLLLASAVAVLGGGVPSEPCGAEAHSGHLSAAAREG